MRRDTPARGNGAPQRRLYPSCHSGWKEQMYNGKQVTISSLFILFY